jgi:hypothetical protein
MAAKGQEQQPRKGRRSITRSFQLAMTRAINLQKEMQRPGCKQQHRLLREKRSRQRYWRATVAEIQMRMTFSEAVARVMLLEEDYHLRLQHARFSDAVGEGCAGRCVLHNTHLLEFSS